MYKPKELWLRARKESEPALLRGQYFHIYLTCVWREEDDCPRNDLYWPYDDLRVGCQGESTTPYLYGFEVEYHDVYSVDLRRAEKMVKTLRAVSAKLERMREKEGDARTFGEYVVRVAKALGAAGGVREIGGGGHSSYTDSAWRWMTVADLRGLVDMWADEWLREVKPKE